MHCRTHCGACCIAPSITSAIPGMPNGKAAGERCIHLTEDYRCAIFTDPRRPKACDQFQAEEEFCGKNREQALHILAELEIFTQSPQVQKLSL